jgi:hypothetical protein
VSYGVFGTDLIFLSGASASIERRAISATFERRMSDTWTLAASAGAGLPGHILLGGERYLIEPGFFAAVASSWRVLAGEGELPFLLLSVTLGGSGASTRHLRVESERAALLAFDARLGLVVGKTFWDVLSPYAATRVFGGPIFWSRGGEDLIGSDLRHFQFALGMAAALPNSIDFFAEIAPLGERAVNVGGGLTF